MIAVQPDAGVIARGHFTPDADGINRWQLSREEAGPLREVALLDQAPATEGCLGTAKANAVGTVVSHPPTRVLLKRPRQVATERFLSLDNHGGHLQGGAGTDFFGRVQALRLLLGAADVWLHEMI